MKTFTLDEANALIPHILKLLDELTETRNKLSTLGANLSSILEHASGNGGSKAGSEYAMELQSFNAQLSLFQDLGCELKDLDQGLVDFPSQRGEKQIYLCWKRGEPRVQFWHDVDSGMAGRQPI